MDADPIISRHRLPRVYRVGLTVLWIVPLLIFILAMVLGRGVDAALLDPRFVAPALFLVAPALYFWHEGIDVRHGGIYRRIHVPGYYAFDQMARWHYDHREDRHVLTIWDRQGQKIVECRAGHLTDFPALLRTLEERL